MEYFLVCATCWSVIWGVQVSDHLAFLTLVLPAMHEEVNLTLWYLEKQNLYLYFLHSVKCSLIIKKSQSTWNYIGTNICVNRITFLQDKEVKCVQVNVMSIQKESVNLLLYKLHFFSLPVIIQLHTFLKLCCKCSLCFWAALSKITSRKN